MDLELCSFLDATFKDSELSPSNVVFTTHGAVLLAERIGRLLPNTGYQTLGIWKQHK